MTYRKSKPKEADVLRDCRQLLSVYRNMGLLDFFRISTTGRPAGDGGFYSNQDQRGFPDIIVWIYDGPDLYIELKSRTGKLSDSQKAFMARANAANKHYIIIRSGTELSLVLSRFLGNKNPAT